MVDDHAGHLPTSAIDFVNVFECGLLHEGGDHFCGWFSSRNRNQPHIAHWNLSVLAQALLPLLDDNPEKALASGQAAIDTFPELYMTAYRNGMLEKLGLQEKRDDDEVLIQDLLNLMQEESTDFTLTFRHLADLTSSDTPPDESVASIFKLPGAFDPWLERWRQRLDDEPQDANTRQERMYAVNPVYIPRNHLVEEAIEVATRQGDFEAFNRLVDVLSQPGTFDPANARFAMPPLPEQIVRQTFCGT